MLMGCRVGPLAAAADDARADARPGRGLDPRDRGGAPPRGGRDARARRRPQGRGDGARMPLGPAADAAAHRPRGGRRLGGNLARGHGVISAGSSGAFIGLSYSLPTRIGDDEGKTSPEELLAGAHGAASRCRSPASSPGPRRRRSASTCAARSHDGRGGGARPPDRPFRARRPRQVPGADVSACRGGRGGARGMPSRRFCATRASRRRHLSRSRRRRRLNGDGSHREGDLGR